MKLLPFHSHHKQHIQNDQTALKGFKMNIVGVYAQQNCIHCLKVEKYVEHCIA